MNSINDGRGGRAWWLWSLTSLAACGGGGADPGVTADAMATRAQALAVAAPAERVANGSFETPQVAPGTFVLNPTQVGGWTFAPVAGRGNAVLSSTDSGFTRAAPPSGAGSQVVALQGLAGVSQTLQLDPGDEIWVRATQRANYNPDPGAFGVVIDGVSLLGSMTAWRTSGGATDLYVQPPTGAWHLYRFAPLAGAPLAAGPHNVALNAGGYYRYGEYPDHTVLLDDVRVVKVSGTPLTVAVDNGSFETPALPVGSFQYRPAGTGWTLAGGAALAQNGSGFFKSPFGGVVGATTVGAQVAVLQGNASMSRSLVLAPGDVLTLRSQPRQSLSVMTQQSLDYMLSTGAPQETLRPGWGLRVYVDGVLQPETFAPVTPFSDMGTWTTQRFALSSVLSSGTHTLEIRSVLGLPYPDWAVLVDDLRIERLQLL